MVIERITLIPYALPFTHVWQDYGQTLSERRGWIIELVTAEGLRGFGDCAPLPAHGTEQPMEAEATLKRIIQDLSGHPLEQAMGALPDRNSTPAARCALETALLDLESQLAGVPLAKYLASDAVLSIKVAAALGPLDQLTGQALEQAGAAGFDRYKLKVGLAPPEIELAQLRLLCSALPSTVRLRLDANRAWPLPQAVWFVSRLDGLPIEFIEEPLAEPGIESLRKLRAATACRLALDESLREVKLAPLLKEELADTLVLKPMLQGGLIPCLELAAKAQQANLDCVVTTSLESAVGAWATAHLATAVQGQRPPLAHGLDTSRWFARDLAPAPSVEAATIHLSTRVGLGIPGQRHIIESATSELTGETFSG